MTEKTLITGARGFVGTHLRHRFDGAALLTPHRSECNLGHYLATMDYFRKHTPERVFHLAARCGGIGANQKYPADFIFENLQMGLNVIKASYAVGVKTLVMVGTLCSFPKETSGPIGADDLWLGYPEETNAPYGIAKRTLIEVSRAYHQQHGLKVVNVCPTNMYGPNDNFDDESSHVIPALIKRFVRARDTGADEVVCWGSGKPTRDFLFVDDAVDGLIKAAETLEEPSPVLLGTGVETSMAELSQMVADAVGYHGRITWNTEKPDGQPRRVVDTSGQQERLGFMPSVDLFEGIRRTVEWYGCGSGKPKIQYPEPHMI